MHNWSIRDLSLHTYSDDSDSSDEDGEISTTEAYKAIDIRKGLLTPRNYCTAVPELESIILGLYRDKSFSKNTKKLIEDDVRTAINECSFGELHARALQALMNAVEKQFPQAKRQNLLREYRQRILQHKRSHRHLKSKANDDGDESDQCPKSCLPKECLEIVFSHLDPVSLAIAAATCTLWRDIAYDNSFWKPLAELTYGKTMIDEAALLWEELEETPNFRQIFNEFASENPEWLLPWRTDRITCHGVVRWISPETRKRLMSRNCIAYDRRINLAFMAPGEVTIWLHRRRPAFLKLIVSDRDARSIQAKERIATSLLARLGEAEGVPPGIPPSDEEEFDLHDGSTSDDSDDEENEVMKNQLKHWAIPGYYD